MRYQHRPILLANPKHKHRMAASFYIIEPASCRACSRVLAAFGCADDSCPQTGTDITAAPTAAAAAAALAAAAAAASTVVAHIRMESLLVGHVLHRLNATVRQQNVILAVRDAISVAVLRMAKVVAGMRVAHAIAKRVAGSVLLQLRRVRREW